MSAGKDHKVEPATGDPERPAKGRKEYVDAARAMLSFERLEQLEQLGIGVFDLEMTAIWAAIADLQRGGIALLPTSAEDETLVDALVARREKGAR